MIESSSNLKERSTDHDSPTRQQLEDTIIRQKKKKNKQFKSPSSADHANSWLGLKDPRIVRVSRAFGGKDRHSKVCTVRGLRDRRVRLSVPTAIQLYDLQDRLGLNQPSKVVDWLLNAAKDEIDHLPPLSIPPGCFSFNHQMMMMPQQPTSSGHAAEDEDGGGEEDDNNDDQQWLNNSSSSSVVPFGTANYDHHHHHLDPHTNFGFTQHDDDDDDHKYLEDNFKFVQLPPALSLSSSSSATHQILVPSNHQDQLHPRTISDHHHHHLQMFSSASQTNNGNIPPFFAPHQSPRPNFQLN